MKGSRTWNRRDFSVTANGYFTVLKADGWFPTLRLPGGFRYRLGQPKAPVPPPTNLNPPQNPAAALMFDGASQPGLYTQASNLAAATSRLQILPPATGNPSLIRPILIALAATLIAFLLLCWTAWPLVRGYLASIAH